MRTVTESQGNAREVLVVEDDPDIRELLCELLEEAGCHAQGAVNGEHALEVLGRRAPPHLILLDLMMPVMDGVTFLQRLREVPQCLKVPVVILSASFQLCGALRVPGDVEAVLHKPVDLDELLGTVGRYCRLPAGREALAPV